jgi:hypothetical protein
MYFQGMTNASANGTTPTSTNNTTVVEFGEFALIDPEVVPVQKVLNNITGL